MKKILQIIVFILILFSTPLPQTIHAQTNIQAQVYKNTAIFGEHIQSFDSKININKDGSIDVGETIIYDFSNLTRHGIFRTIPYTKISPNGKTLEISFSDFSVKDEFGNDYKFTKTTIRDNIQLKIGDPNKVITGLHTYVISYKAKGEIGYFDNHDELYWNVTGNEWKIPIAKATSTIYLPENIKKESLKTKCFTGIYGSKDENCSISVDENSISFAANDFLPEQNGLTALVGFPKGTIATLLPTERILFFDTILGKIVLILIFLGVFLWYVLLPVLLGVIWFYKGRDPDVGKPARAWFDPPKTKNGRELTPAETGGLVDENVDNRDVFSTIVNLAQRGYLVIEEKTKQDFTLVKKKEFKDDPKLLDFEKKLLEGIFGDDKTCRLKDKELYKEVFDVKNTIYKNLVTDGFFSSNPQTIRAFYYVLAILGLSTANVSLGITAFIFGRVMPRKTLFGAQQANIGKSLKNFLSSQERQLKFQADKQMMFEKLLPYAVAFGVEKIWAERFSKFKLQPPEWYHGYSGSTFNAVIFTNTLASSYSSFASASHPPTSGSGFGGGGFSGGGGGGGGGGSW